ncbi:MAG: fibronectin type III domain-containing protein [Desulfuromonadaceae bacterium]|nr:fibronectin type III domain-containing protein [Desulfuromonadaceae bacterium]
MRRFVNSTFITLTAVALMVIGLMLAGCGGSGGGMSSQVLSGNASVGSPLAGQVNLKDSSSPPQLKTTIIGSDGSFAFDITGLKAPYILQGTGSAAGTSYKLHSFADGVGIANVNPLSNVVVAGAAGVKDPEQLYAAPDPNTLQKIKSGLPVATSDILNQLQPLLKLYSADGKDPIKDHYDSDHQGLDGMFDNVNITIPNGIITVTNAKTGAVIYTASVIDIKNGQFSLDPGTLPQAPVVNSPGESSTSPEALPPTTAVPVLPALPAAPTGVIATGGTKQVALSWSSVNNATSYNVYYATTPGVTTANGTKIANTATPAVQTELTAATTYYYIVTAVNSIGESAPSVQVAATTLSATPAPTTPAVPASLTAVGGTNKVTLSWAAAGGASSYNLYWSTTPGVTTANGTKVAGITTPYVKTGLAAGTAYYFIVTATNSAGESAPSPQVTATTSAPVPVFKQLTLAWDPVAGASSYNLYWSTVPGVTTANGTKISGISSPSYVHTGLAAGTTYYYVVTAVNSANESAASIPASGTTAL